MHVLNIIEVAEDEGLAHVEAARDDVLGVLHGEAAEIVQVVVAVHVLALPQVPARAVSTRNVSEFASIERASDKPSTYFSSSVIWITSGTLNAFCIHWVIMNGSRCPRCMEPDEGPRPVYR